MKLQKIWIYFRRALPFLLIAALLLALLFFPREKEQETVEATRIIRIWNVDTFEGGKGSRTAFLRSTAREYEKKHNGVYFLVTNYTLEGAEEAFYRGELPDMLSFGIGLWVYAERSLPLPYSFAGGSMGSETLAVPWCRGRYALFSLTDDFEAEGTTAISVGGSNLSSVAAELAGIDGEEAESTAAYTGFLSGKYRYLLGTQRDVCRFQIRGVQVYERALSGYNDLYQVISVFSQEKREDCLAFLAYLRSADVQSGLDSIGMLPVTGDESERTVSVFSDASALENLRGLARQNGDGKNLDKFLKTI